MKRQVVGVSVILAATAVALLVLLLQSNLLQLFAGGLYFDSGQSLGSDSTYDVALADLDGDGDVDAFAANNISNRVWQNDGDGCFSNSGQTPGTSSSRGVAIGHLNGDSYPDVFVGNHSAGNEVWLNDVNGNLTVTGQMMTPVTNTVDVALGDLVAGGGLDAFVVNENGFEVWANDGTAVFILDQSFGGSNSVRQVALGDLDGDTDLDAYIANGNNSVEDEIWFNNSGTFISDTQTLSFAWNEGVALADLDGDDDLDVYLANWSGSDEVWINQGGIQAGTEGEFANSSQTLSGGGSTDVVLVDVNDDTALDAVVAKWVNTANGEVWLNDGSGNFSLSSSVPDNSGSYALAAANLDGDSVPDLFFGNFGPNKVFLTAGCRRLARFNVTTRQNMAGQLQYPWAQSGDAILPILLNFVPNSPLNVQAGIQSGGSVMTETVPFATTQTTDDLTVTNPLPVISETVTITLKIETEPPQTDAVPPLSLTFINVGEDDTLCSLCFIDWLLKLMGFETSFWMLHHMNLNGLRDGDSWNYYHGLFNSHNDELTTIIATNPELLWQTWDALDTWTPAIQAVEDGNGAMVPVTQPMVDQAMIVLEGIRDNAGPQLAAQIQTEINVLEIESMVNDGLTMDDVVNRVDNRIDTLIYLPVISK